MPSYKAPLRDMSFVMRELFDFSKIQVLPSYGDTTNDLVDAILYEAAKFSENVLLPLNQSGDQEGCRYDNGAVITLLAVTGLTHKVAYKDIFVITMIKTAAVFVVIGFYYVTGIY